MNLKYFLLLFDNQECLWKLCSWSNKSTPKISVKKILTTKANPVSFTKKANHIKPKESSFKYSFVPEKINNKSIN